MLTPRSDASASAMPRSLRCRRVRKPRGYSPLSMFTARLESTHEPAAPPARALRSASWSTPARRASAIPSATEAYVPAMMTWFTAFATCPAPLGPTCVIVRPRTPRRGLARSSASASPPTITDGVPFPAPSLPPRTGAPSMAAPRAAGPPARRRAAAGPRVRLWTVTSCPAASRRLAMGAPIVPRPTKPARMLPPSGDGRLLPDLLELGHEPLGDRAVPARHLVAPRRRLGRLVVEPCRQLHAQARPPLLAPGRRHRRRELPSGQGGPGPGPGARHRAVGVVAAPAREDQAPARQLVGQLHEPRVGVAHAAQREREVGQGVAVVHVGAGLRHDQVGGEAPQRPRHDGVEGLREAVVVGERLERHVHRGAPSGAVAGLVGEAGAGEEVAARLVQADREHA